MGDAKSDWCRYSTTSCSQSCVMMISIYAGNATNWTGIFGISTVSIGGLKPPQNATLAATERIRPHVVFCNMYSFCSCCLHILVVLFDAHGYIKCSWHVRSVLTLLVLSNTSFSRQESWKCSSLPIFGRAGVSWAFKGASMSLSILDNSLVYTAVLLCRERLAIHRHWYQTLRYLRDKTDQWFTTATVNRTDQISYEPVKVM